MTVNLRILAPVWDGLRRYHLDPAVRRERISYAFGTLVRPDGGPDTVVVTRPPILLGDDCYIAQSGGHVSLDPVVLNAILAEFAAGDHDVLVNVHDHFFAAAGTTFSSIDTADELRLEDYIRRRFEPMLEAVPGIGRPRRVLNVALVLDQAGCDARYLDGGGRFKPVGRIDIVGTSPRRVVPNSRRPAAAGAAGAAVMRHRDFITAEQQRYIAETTVAIAGCGGLGSIAAESFFRLGVRRFVLIDDDVLEAHNLNRWQGGRAGDAGQPKASLIEASLHAMAGPGVVSTLVARASVNSDEGIAALKDADIIIGGLDNHLARFFLNRFAIQYAVPYLDAGVSIVAGDPVDFQSRVFTVIPGSTACMECTSFQLFDRTAISWALMDPETAAERRAAGYVDARPDIDAAASAYALNMRAVSRLVTEFTNLVCGYRPVATCVYETWAGDKVNRADRDNHPEVPDSECPVCSALIGACDHAELPRPYPEGRAAQLLEAARGVLCADLTRPSSNERK